MPFRDEGRYRTRERRRPRCATRRSTTQPSERTPPARREIGAPTQRIVIDLARQLGRSKMNNPSRSTSAPFAIAAVMNRYTSWKMKMNNPSRLQRRVSPAASNHLVFDPGPGRFELRGRDHRVEVLVGVRKDLIHLGMIERRHVQQRDQCPAPAARCPRSRRRRAPHKVPGRRRSRRPLAWRRRPAPAPAPRRRPPCRGVAVLPEPRLQNGAQAPAQLVPDRLCLGRRRAPELIADASQA